MKKLTQEELSSLSLKKSKFFSNVASTPYYRAMAELNIGEALLIEKSEWPNKGGPLGINIPKRYKIPSSKYRTNQTADDRAYVISRVG